MSNDEFDLSNLDFDDLARLDYSNTPEYTLKAEDIQAAMKQLEPERTYRPAQCYVCGIVTNQWYHSGYSKCAIPLHAECQSMIK